MTTRIDDFRAILDGSSSQHLTAAWQHFVGEEFDPQRFAQASIDFVKAWDWDWVKVNPRATYYSEIWGSRYDPEDYQGPIPRLITPAISGPADLARISPIAVADSPVLLEHLTSARLIREALDDRVVLQTIFSPEPGRPADRSPAARVRAIDPSVPLTRVAHPQPM